MLGALRQAAANDLMAGLRDGLDTIIGDRGILVSHGERQRLALARAFLRNPSMLILDEATSSLDSENEGRVLDAIERRRGEFTVVLIAHRLSTVRRADLIYVIEGGRVVESGDWSSLSALQRWPFPCAAGGAKPDDIIRHARCRTNATGRLALAARPDGRLKAMNMPNRDSYSAHRLFPHCPSTVTLHDSAVMALLAGRVSAVAVVAGL